MEWKVSTLRTTLSMAMISLLLAISVGTAPYTYFSPDIISAMDVEYRSNVIEAPAVWQDDFNDSSRIATMSDARVLNGTVVIAIGASKGIVASVEILCPTGMRYDFMLLRSIEPGNCSIRVAILNASEPPSTPGYVNEPIPGFGMSDARELQMSAISPAHFPSIRLQANLEANGTVSPSLLWWAVYFVGQDEWRDDFIGSGKLRSRSMVNITDGTVELNLSLRRAYTSGRGEYEAYPSIITNHYWNGPSNPFYVFYPKEERTGYRTRVQMGDHNAVDFEIGDLDDDGHLDLVTTNNNYNEVTTTSSWVLWGNESDEWSTSRCTNMTTVGAMRTTVGDFNCDGLLDLAFSSGSTSDACVRVFMNKGNRAFGLLPDVVIPTLYVHGLDAGDLNNDGFDDIIVAEEPNNGNSEVFYGGPTGPDTKSDATYPVPRGWDVIAQDLNGDDFLDLAFCSMEFDGKDVLIFLGGPDGPDTTVDYILNVNNGADGISAGDVNSDGFTDLVVARTYHTNPKTIIYMGSLAGWSTNDRKLLDTSADVSESEIVDINKDGYDDVVATSNSYNDVRIYYGGSSGISGTEDLILNTNSPMAIKVAVPCKKSTMTSGSIISQAIDLPDGRKWDVLVLDSETPDGTSVEATVLDGNYRPIEGLSGLHGPDIDLAGLDIPRIHLKITLSSAGRVVIPRLNTVLLKWMYHNEWRDEFYGRAKTDRMVRLSVLDRQLGPTPDLALCPELFLTGLHPDTSSSAESLVFSGCQGGDYRAISPIQLRMPNGASALDIGDANDDGHLDIVFAVPRTSDTCSTALSSLHLGGPLGIGPIPDKVFKTTGAIDVLLEDLDKDGRMDIVFANERDQGDYSTSSQLFVGRDVGWNETPDVEFSTFGASGVDAVDVNGDGRLDLAFACYRDVTTSTDSLVFLQGANGFCGTHADYYLPTNGARAVASGDLNRDGRIDLAFANSQASGLATTDSYIYWGKTGGGFQTTPTRLPTVGARDVALADLDQDLDLDIVFANERDDFLDYSIDSYVYLNDGSGGFGTGPAARLPTVGAVAVEVANLDNTGNLDIIFACAYDGTSFNVPARAFLGGASGWPADPSFTLPMTGGSDVRAAQVFKPGTGAYVSRDISPLDPYDTGTFHTLRCDLSLDAQQKVGIGLIDAKTWEVLVEREAGAGALEWDLSGVFRVKEHPSVRVFVTVPSKAALQAFAMDDLWLNWTKRVRVVPDVLAMNVSSPTVLRTKSLDLNALITDEYDLAGELTVEFACKPNASSVWTSSYISNVGFVQGNWTARFLPPANAVVGAYDLKVTVTDKDWLSTDLVVGSVLRVINNRPSTPEVRLSPGRPVTTDTLTVSIFQRASDVENEPISYHYVWFMDAVRQAGLTGTSVDPSLTTRGQNWTVEVRAFDGLDEGEPARAWAIIQNAPPIATGKLAIRSMQEDTVDSTSVNLTGAFEDPDGDALTWRLLSESLNVSVSIDADIGQVTIAPRRNWYGWENVTFIASDGELQAEQRLLITVLPVDDPPMIVAVNGEAVGTGPIHLMAVQDEVLFINITVLDIEDDALVFSTSTQRVSIDVNGSIRFVPTNDDIGTLTFEVVAMEERYPTMRSSVNITLDILNVNDPMTSPVIISPQNGTRFASNQSFWLNATCTDPDERHGQALNYTWASNRTGIIGWGPSLRVGALGSGLHNVTLTVSDGEFQRTASVEILVEEPVTPPPPPPPDGEEAAFPTLLAGVLLLIVIAAVVVIVLVLRARKEAAASATTEVPVDEEARKKEEIAKLSGIINETLKTLEKDKPV